MNNKSSVNFPFEDFWIDPITNWKRFFNPQIFISLNNDDLDVENHVLGQAGSYGQQLGCILDVLKVLVSRLSSADLTPAERDAVEDFNELTAQVERAVSECGRGSVTQAQVDRLIHGLADLEKSDPEAHRTLVSRLKEALFPDKGPA